MLSFKGGTLLLREMVTMLEKGCDPLETSFILMYDTCSCVGNCSCTKKKHYFLTHPCIID